MGDVGEGSEWNEIKALRKTGGDKEKGDALRKITGNRDEMKSECRR